jgi:phosphatidylserine/phosphatidylglycerophosphate/cardiolipin synthase-like enzyme
MGMSFRRAVTVVVFAVAMTTLSAPRASALEVMCDTAFEDCRARLLQLIDAERVGIDVGFWVMEDQRYVSHLVARKNAGVPVRVIMEPRSLTDYPLNQTTFNAFQQAGIPMIKKLGGGIMHWKLMIFAGQNTVEFGSANYSPSEFVPDAPYTNYISQTVYYTDDPAIVNSFETRFDDLWVNTSTYGVYANAPTRTRSYPIFTISPDLNIPPGQSFTNRLLKLEGTETQKIDVAMYRITQQSHGDGLIKAFNRGVPVRYIGEIREYRLVSRLWVAYNMDRIYLAGIPMRVRAHAGLNHQKLVLLYGQATTVFGSSNFTSPSDNSQQENNYFTTKSGIFQWAQAQFERQWNNSNPVAAVETTPFVPLPPDKPVYNSVANGAVGVPTTGQTLVWYGGPWAHIYDIYFGTDPAAMTALATAQPLGPSETTSQNQSFVLPALQAGTTYYWRIVSKTAALLEKSGPIWSFTTAGSPPPPPGTGLPTIVLWTSNTPPADVHGTWSMQTDTTASGGAALANADAGQAKIAPALAAPSNYFERTFTASQGVPYHLWVRLKAKNNSLSNDSVHVQFTGSQDSVGSPAWRLNTTSSAEVVLQSGSSDTSIAGWGWSDNGWGAPGANIYFDATGSHTVRVQQREDGAIVDEIVLSPDTYFSAPPGAHDNDSTTLPENDGSTPPPPPPPPPPDPTIVLWTAQVPPTGIVGTAWQMLTDGSAAGGSAVWNPDAGKAKIAPALATPASYVEMTFNATAGTPYHLWIRLRAQNDSFSNDSVHVQFNDSVDASGNATMQFGSTSSAEVLLQNGPTGTADHSWGWADNGWGTAGVNVRFATTGSHTLRIQQREDGPIVDQIVLSPNTYLTTPPGPRQNDTKILDPTS